MQTKTIAITGATGCFFSLRANFKQIKKWLLPAAFLLLFGFFAAPAAAQAPTLSYSSPQSYTTGTAVSLLPTSSGVGSPGYNNVILGSGLNKPSGVAVDGAGNMYVTDGGNFAVKKFPAGGGAPVTIYSGYTCQGIAVDASGNVFVANSDVNTLIKIPTGGGTAQTLTQGLKGPMGVALDAAGNIYVTTRTDNSVYRIGPSGGPGALVASGFGNIGGVAVAANGDVYIADNSANGIYKVASAGGGPVKVANVMGAVGVALDGTGNLYAGDFTNARIIEIPADGSAQIVTTTGYAQPILLTADAFGNVYVPYYGASIILEIAHSGGYYTSGLPSGLTLNNSTGVISGTPAANSTSKTYTVQAYNGSGSATANISMQVVGTGRLSALSVSVGSLSPAFAPGTNNYNTNIPAGTGGLQIIPKTADTNAVIKVNGTVVKSGTSSAPISLVQGSNNISIVVTPVNGAANTYTINANDPTSPLPAISYNTPQTYSFGTAITPLSPISNQVAGYGINTDPQSWQPYNAYPVGVTADVAGNVYVLYYQTALVKIPGGNGSPVVMSGSVNGISDIVADAAGNVYGYNGKNVMKYPAAGGNPVSIGGVIYGAYSIAIDNAGNLFFPEPNNNVIMKIPAGGGSPVVAYTCDYPTAIGFDLQGNAYVICDGQVVGPGGEYDLFKYPANGGDRIYLGLTLYEAWGMAVDGAGNVFESGYKDAHSLLTEVVAGTNQQIDLGSDQYPAYYQVATDRAGNVYAALGQVMPLTKFVPTGGYFINSVPEGLSFDFNSGVLSGTPTNASPMTNYTVTAYNASGSATAPLAIKVVSNPNLKSLAVSGGFYSTPFSPTETTYHNIANNDQTKYYVQPTAYDNTAVIKVNGTVVPSGTISPGIPLIVGINPVSVTVTTADGSVQNYNITVARGSSALSYASPQTWFNNTAIAPVLPIITNPGIPAPAYYQTVIANGLSRTGKLAVDMVGNIYLCDQNTLKKLPAGATATTTINTGISTLTGIAVDAQGNIYLPDETNNAIKKISVSSGAISTLASGLLSPVDISVDASGNIFFIETGDNALKELPAAGGAIVTLAMVPNPTALAMDATGNFYIGDQTDNLVYKVPAGGGSPVTIGAGFNTLEDVTVDAAGNVYVVEGTGTGVKMISATGGAPLVVIQFASQAEADGITLDGAGDIFYCNYISSSSTATITKNPRVGGYTALTALPAGVTVDYTTGIISGAPTSQSPAKNYNIVGYNAFGGNLAPVNIRVKSSYLTNMVPGAGVISPSFAPATTSYTETVCNATNTISLTPTAADPNAIIRINGTIVASGNALASIPLNVGANVLTVASTDADTSTYTVTITRLAAPSVAINGAFCQPCSPQTLTFTAEVSNGGPTSSYTWYKNNIAVGTNNSVYVDNALVANDRVWCVITSNATCVLSNAVTSNVVTVGTPAIASVTPASGPVGTLVTITGSNFGTLTSLSIAGVAAIPVSNTDTQLVAMVMPGAGAGNIAVSTISGSATSAGSFTVTPTSPPVIQQGGKIVATSGVTATSQVGHAVAISADGNTAVAAINIIPGGVIVFTRQNGAWTQQAMLSGNGGAGSATQGSAVAISADGNTVLFSAQTDAGGKGAFWSFTRSNGVWLQQGGKLTGSDAAAGSPGSNFGSALSLSADGNTAVIGGTYDNANVGAAWIFTRNGTGVWVQNGNKLTGAGESLNAYFGNSAAISADGNTALVGGFYDNGRTGAVWAFTNNNGTWTQQGSKLLATGATGGLGEFGDALALSADGNTALIGGYHDNNLAGAAWVFTRSNGVWAVQGNKLTATGATGTNLLFGQSVSLSADGNVAFVGAPDDNNYTGATWVFRRSNGSWAQFGSKVTGGGETVNSFQPGIGQSVALSADGSTAIVSDQTDNANAGAGWVFIPATPIPLSNLAISAGTLSPVFSGSVNSYTASVNGSVTSVTLTPAVSNSSATITVNGVATASGTASNPVSLAYGVNNIPVMVTASDGFTTDNYTVAVTRLSNDATLANISLSNGSLNPVFAPGVNSYAVSVNTTVTSLMVTPAANNAGATVTVNGIAVMSGNASQSVALSPGANAIHVVVTSQDGTSQITYTINVSQLSGNDNLAILTVNYGTFSPSFDPGITSYTMSLSNAITSLKVTPVTADPNATAYVNNNLTASYSATIAPLSIGLNNVNILVVAQDGVTTQTYTIAVTVTQVLPPAISYSGPEIYYVNNAILPLAPTNTGGAVASADLPLVYTFAGHWYGAVNGTGTDASFAQPPCIGTDGQGNVYVADQNNNMIRKITPDAVVTTLAGSGAAGFVNGTGAVAQFNQPRAVAGDAQGNVYVADSFNNAIRKITPDGTVSTYAGTGTAGYADGPAGTAMFNFPYGVAVDPQGNLFVADLGNHRVRKITSDGTVSTFAGGGPGNNTNGTGTAASFATVYAVATDNQGNVYVADSNNNNIRKISPAGAVSTLAGSGAQGSANGSATSASFNSPAGLAADAQGNVYVADGGNNLIRKINPAGTVSTLAGNGIAGGGNGTGTDAGFNYPTSVATDYNGNVFVCDNGNNLIRKVITSAYTISPALPAGLSFDNTKGIISGAPLSTSPVTNYNITAYNAGGSSRATVNLTVLSQPTITPLGLTTLNEPGVILYSVAFSTAQTGVSASNFTVTGTSATQFVIGVTGSGTSYTVSLTVLPGARSSGTVILNMVNNTGISPGASGLPVSGPAVQVNYPDPGATLTLTSSNANPAYAKTGDQLNYTLTTNGYNINYAIITAGDNQTYNSGTQLPAASGYLTLGSSTPQGAIAYDFTCNYTIGEAPGVFGGSGTSGIIFDSQPPTVSISAPSANAVSGNGTVSVFYTITYADANFGSSALTTSGITLNKTGTATGTVGLTGSGSSYTVTIANISGSGTLGISVGAGYATDKAGNTDAGAAPPDTFSVITANNYLSSLTLSSGTLSPAFATATTSYTASLSNATTGITVTPTTSDPKAIVTVNGAAILSGTASSIPLYGGVNNISIVVTAQDGTQKTYTITITKPLSNNANLANLAIGSGTLSPVFTSQTTVYTASVVNAISSITLTPTTSDVNATVQVNGVTVASGTASASIPLAQGTTSIHAVVHAQDGTQKTYTVTVTRLPNNANLANLAISTGTLSPAFTSQTTGYTGTVTNATSITVTPTTSDTKATVTVAGVATISGTASAAIRLNGGVNTIYIVGIAQDGTRKTYTLTITKPLSSNANLSNLAISSGTLAPVFVNSTVAYTATVSTATTSIQLTPTTSDVNATVQVNSITVKSGAASASVPLGIGVNSVHAVVHAQDGTQRTYTVTVTRLSNNANMANLTISSGRLTPAFTSQTTSYLDTVRNATTSIQITPTTSDTRATVTVNGAAVISGSASAAIPLVVGNNTIYEVVLAQDGTRKTYATTVRRLTPGGLNNLYLPGVDEQTPLTASLNEKVEANNILSPNGDGINDVWVVKNIAFYPDNTVTVYDRAGEVVYTKKGYTNDWDGTYRGSALNEGTYYYSVDLGNGKNLKGFITVVSH